ncbi:GcrA family cell cycle regulator [Cucumibacter marinus]|uniref:GcrA family cell cycle regulator n=1 Tax=Cucumibacter marinus TaxID=1121252 RepID=UPI000412DC75|nr:GcrA family cell cycle regulator [Cucumibacter marinus]
MAWTDERVELLKKLWMEGLSASQIAAELGEGVTRNAVIGKVHRLKLSGRAKPASTASRARKPRASNPAPRRPSGASSSSAASAIAKRRQMTSAPMIGATALKYDAETDAETLAVADTSAELYIEPEKRVDLMGLNEHTCKWPIGDPMSEDFYFCGRHSDEGRPYCEFHSRRAYHAVERKKK